MAENPRTVSGPPTSPGLYWLELPSGTSGLYMVFLTEIEVPAPPDATDDTMWELALVCACSFSRGINLIGGPMAPNPGRVPDIEVVAHRRTYMSDISPEVTGRDSDVPVPALYVKRGDDYVRATLSHVAHWLARFGLHIPGWNRKQTQRLMRQLSERFSEDSSLRRSLEASASMLPMADLMGGMITEFLRSSGVELTEELNDVFHEGGDDEIPETH